MYKKGVGFLSNVEYFAFFDYFPDFPVDSKGVQSNDQNHEEEQSNSTHFPEEGGRSVVLQPIFGDFNKNVVEGFYCMVVPWEVYFQRILPDGTHGIDVVLSDPCGKNYTYLLEGSSAWLKATSDVHETSYDSYAHVTNISQSLAEDGRGLTNSNCSYIISIYPTKKLEDSYSSRDPIVYAVGVAMIFVFTTMVFLVYDWAVQRRQWMIIRAARKTQAIVSSLFPKNVQDRIMKDVDEEVNRDANKPLIMRGNRTKDQLQNFLKGKDANEEDEEDIAAGIKRSKPIADLFPEATIIFADIVGFTAWSSTREPTQVFQLLETIYHVFDEIANRRRVFKVETVGDCYVAVAGLPEPRKDHAIVMARFARDCLIQFTATVKAMVVELGPDTEEVRSVVQWPSALIRLSFCS